MIGDEGLVTVESFRSEFFPEKFLCIRMDSGPHGGWPGDIWFGVVLKYMRSMLRAFLKGEVQFDLGNGEEGRTEDAGIREAIMTW